MFHTVIIHKRSPVNALRPDGLCALNKGTFVDNHCIKHSKLFVIPIIDNLNLDYKLHCLESIFLVFLLCWNPVSWNHFKWSVIPQHRGIKGKTKGKMFNWVIDRWLIFRYNQESSHSFNNTWFSFHYCIPGDIGQYIVETMNEEMYRLG